MSVAATETVTSWSHALTIIWILLIAMVAVGTLLIVGRKVISTKDSSSSTLVRSWLAVLLTFGLLLFTVVAMTIEDTTTRSVLIGAVASNAGAAVAFYFASKTSDQARQDILGATFGTENVPDLVGKTLDEARSALGATSLALRIASLSPSMGKVSVQDPLKNSKVLKGSEVNVTLDGSTK